MTKMTVSLETEEKSLGQLLKQVLLVRGVTLLGIGISQEPVQAKKEPFFKPAKSKGGKRESKRPQLEALLKSTDGPVTLKEMMKVLKNPFVHVTALIKEKKLKKISKGSYKWIGERS